MLYLISYDLAKPKKDYPPLIKALEKARAVRVLYSEWLLASDEDAEAIHAAIREAGQLDNDDSLFVAELAADAVWDKGRLRATDAVVQKLFANARC